MAADMITVIERLAAQPAEEKAIRNRLISEGWGLREATARARQITGRTARRRPAIDQKVLAEAVSAAIERQAAGRKAAKRAKRAARESAARAAAESAVTRTLITEQQLARQFSEASLATMLHEASSGDLGFAYAAAIAGSAAPAPEVRETEVTTPPSALALEDLPLGVLYGHAGASPFWTAGPGTAATAGRSPFWKGWDGA